MASMILSGDTSGAITVSAPAVAGTNTITFPANTGTVLTTASTFAGTGPAFSAYPSTGQSIAANGTAVKISANTEEFDTASCYDTALARFLPNVAGYYQINGCATLLNAVSTRNFGTVIFKNGSPFKQGTTVPIFANDYAGSNASAVIYMNGTTDYVELFCFNNHSSAINTVVSGVSFCYFNGAFVRAA
jgi:hypothetical protein